MNIKVLRQNYLYCISILLSQVGISYKKVPVTWRDMYSTYESSEGNRFIFPLSFPREQSHPCGFVDDLLGVLVIGIFAPFGRRMGSLAIDDGGRAHGSCH